MRLLFIVGLAVLAAGCSKDASNTAPPRVDTPAIVPVTTSMLTVPASASLDDMERMLNAKVNKTLTTINKKEKACVKPAKLTACLKRDAAGKCKIGFDKLKITPSIACEIKGSVERGPIRLSGSGGALRLSMPVTATVKAQDADHILPGETATAKAEVRAKINLALNERWEPEAKVNIDYDWTEKPGIDMLGVRITFAGKADKSLEPVIATLEKEVSEMLKKVHTRAALEDVWEQAFTVQSLNRKNPEVWLRITPQTLHLAPWRVEGRRIVLPIQATAEAETFVGSKPEPRPVTPLPAPAAPAENADVVMHIPVVAKYEVLEPVLAKALGKLSAKGLKLADYGRADVKFGDVTIYPTSGGKLAVGLEIDAKAPRDLIEAKGTIWLTAKPVNAPGSQIVSFTDLAIASRTDSPGFELLAAVAELPAVRDAIEKELTQDFSNDFGKLLAKIEPKIAEIKVGKSFVIAADLTEVRNGQVVALGQGLYMPVDMGGTARLIYRAPSEP